MIQFTLSDGAFFGAGGIESDYRYLLWRAGARPVCWIMLNPSTADAQRDDQTILACRRFSKVWGFDGIVVANLFGFRSTDPRQLKTRSHAKDYIIGPENDRYILQAARHAASAGAPIVVAWGNPGKLLRRDQQVLTLLRDAGYNPQCIGLNKNGTPWHPLYRPSELKPVPYAA